MRPSQWCNIFSRDLVALTLALVMCLFARTSAAAARASTASQDRFTLVLFGDSLGDGFDGNHDGALSVADIVGLLFAGPVAELEPHGVGDELVYRVTDPLGMVTTESTQVLSADTQGGFLVDYKVTSGQQVQARMTQSYTDTGSQLLFGGFTDLFFTPHTVTTCHPLLLRLITPLLAGQTDSTTVECEVRFVIPPTLIGTAMQTDTFTPQEIVESLTLAAGTFTSVVHISGTTDQDGPENDDFWIAPGVGLILRLQSISGQTYRHELVSGTIGNHPVGP